MVASQSERSPLLQRSSIEEADAEPQVVGFSSEDSENPRLWTKSKKLANVAIIALMAILSPLASSMFTPGISQIADSLHTTEDLVIGATTGFVVTLGLGPLILAPLSETFGRRTLYLVCFSIFSLIQIPTALSPNIATLIACRTLAGFFGSVGISNGGGTISDMFLPSERASIFGWYLLGPLLGPTLGPLFGGVTVTYLGWRWVFWILTIVCMINTAMGFFFLKESYAPVILQRQCAQREKDDGIRYTFDGQDNRPMGRKIVSSVQRPLKILFTQPIVIIMATYQAVVFATIYTLFTNMEKIYSDIYGLSNTQVGLLYLGPGLGFLSAVWFLIPRIDTIYNKLTERNDGEAKPEFRLPIANVGSVCLPVALFSFGWSIQYELPWIVSILATFLWGVGQVCIFNTVQNYYIDAFSKYAASAIAAGAMFRSLVGGVAPLLAPSLFRKLGYGWGWSVYGFLALLLAPSPLLFMRYGEGIRKRFAIDL